MTRWEFKLAPGGLQPWRWQSTDPDTGSILKMSSDPFGTLYECVKDAEMNGYTQSPASLRRLFEQSQHSQSNE